MNRRQLLSYGIGSFVLAACSRARATPDARCAPTADNIEGPFYKPDAPHRAALIGPRTPGERLRLTGRVRSTSCAPLAGVTLDFWHADHRGGYDHDGFGFRGQLVTDADGRWQLDTIVPGRYLNGRRYRPAHIHVKVRAPDRPELTTQLYFAGDPYLRDDPWAERSLVLAHVRHRARRIAAFDFVV